MGKCSQDQIFEVSESNPDSQGCPDPSRLIRTPDFHEDRQRRRDESIPVQFSRPVASGVWINPAPNRTPGFP